MWTTSLSRATSGRILNVCAQIGVTSSAWMAGFMIGLRVSDVYVSHIGLAVGRGAAVSVVLVMTVLPQFILLMDKLIDKTSFTLHLPSAEDAAQPDLAKEEQA